ncbi:PhzF family phenazine biosynthesis protein [Nonomuraea sp. NPDC049129]|uniref:PhzF family phenazine biosynthesis protein n=1 Tax=Nonomuraea sp. NPDC049129 TaxID=3155272 RepID=UPI0033D08A5E
MATGYHHVDVFSDRPFTGNSLAVFVDPPPLGESQMARLTQELRHFETIFVRTTDAPDVVHARVFDLMGELDFAGHPVLGAAAVLHERAGVAYGEERNWSFALGARNVDVTTRGDTAGQVSALLDQGRPELLPSTAPRGPVAAALGLTAADLDDTLPPEVISTGLRYLVVPVRDADVLARARITHPDFEGFLGGYGAQYVYVLDAGAVEGRHWNNDGVLEDVATGSAAGCVAAYLMRHGRARDGQELSLAQGRFTGRPSRIAITAYGTPDVVERVTVGGGVSMVATGALRALPEAS